jgi:hypothetical protein
LSRVWFRQVLEQTGEATVYQLETIILNCPQTSFNYPDLPSHFRDVIKSSEFIQVRTSCIP